MIAKKTSPIVGALLFLLMISFQSGFAQTETAQISGTVVDPANAVVPGATVTATSTKTGFTRTTTTDDEGRYAIANLQPSTYEITIKSGNFAEYKVTKDLSVGSSTEFNATLSASAGAVVDVTANGGDIGEINTTDQIVSEVISTKQIENLPTITRDPYQFVTTLSTVSEADNGGRGVGVAINGQRSASTSILLNGGENVDTFVAGPGQSVPIDSVQEYRVVTGTFTADYGRATGGVVNLTTKSGQNRFFGSAYAFNRNSKFASAGFDANARITATDRANGVQARQYFNRNDYGFSVGGPIIKSKLLFFTNTEWRKVRSTGSLTALVPSAASIAAAAPATRTFFANYTLGATRTGVTQSLAGTGGRVLTFDQVRYSVPNDTGAGTPVDGYQSANRVDLNVSNKFQVYGIYSFEKRTFPVGTNADSPYNGFNAGSRSYNQNIQGTGTYLISSNLVSTTRFTYNRLFGEQPLGDQPVGPTLYLRTTPININGGSTIAFPGYLPFSPGGAIPFGGPQKVYNPSEQINYNRGNNQITAGFQYYKIADDRTFGAFQNAVETLGNSNSTAVDNFFNGFIQTFQTAINPQGKFPGQSLTTPVGAPSFKRNNRYSEYSVFGMDSFKLFPNFNVNVGLRYEYYGPQRNTDRSLDSNFYFGGDGTLTPDNIRSGNVLIASNSPSGELWKADKNNFGPSVGFAYDIEGNGKSSLRAGYALRYERNFGNVTFNVIQNPPAYGVIGVDSSNFGGTPIPITLNNSGPLAGSGGTITLPVVTLRAVDPNIHNAYAHQYSASYQRMIGSFTASAEFSGTSGRELYSIANINRRGSGRLLLGSNATGCAGLASSDRLNCRYGNINYRGNGGRSGYQGITFALESNNLLNIGLQIASRYTYSVSRDNLSSTFSETRTGGVNLGFLDAFNPGLDYGFADFDVRHRFVNTFVWDIPAKKYFSNGIAKTLLSDFTLSGIVKVNSGSPFTVYDCGGNSFSVCYRLIPSGAINYNGSVGSDTGEANTFNFLNLSNQQSVVLPGINANDLFPGENGGLPTNMTVRNAFRGPGNWNTDLALSKKFFFGEKLNLQFRVDAQNVFNHANASVNVGGAADISSTNIITASKNGRRQIQGGIKLIF